MKILLFFPAVLLLFTSGDKNYPWIENYNESNAIEKKISVPDGYNRVFTSSGSFAAWLRKLPLKPEGSPVKLWNGELKYTQGIHAAVVDLDFIGGNLQQCIDVIIRLRAEYLRSAGREDEIAFSYSCCSEKIEWKKWKNGWRTKISNPAGKASFTWIKTQQPDSSEKNFRAYLYNVMNYAGTLSLSRDMIKTDVEKMEAGDAFVEGAAPGLGHGVIILDMAVSKEGKKVVLLGQSYNPAENLNVLKSDGPLSPWFELDFKENFATPQWIFKKEHARRFD